jgi:lipoprotein-releasing system permease protein
MIHFAIATRYLFSKKYKYLPSFSVVLAFFGVFISVATLILVLSVMNGFKEDFEKLVIGTRPHITIYPQDAKFNKINDVILDLQSYSDIGSINPVANGEGVVSFNGKTSGAMIKGVESNYFQARELLKRSIVNGNFKTGEVVLGVELANKLGIRIGDTITIISSKMRKTLFGSLPIHKSYKVSGFFKVDMYIYDSSMVYINIQDASALLFDEKTMLPQNESNNTNISDDNLSNMIFANALEVTLKDPSHTEDVHFVLTQNKRLYGNYITNWKTDNQSFIDAIATQTAVMFLILSLFLIVSSFIIFSTLSSVVNEKKRSIAILQSFGMSGNKVITIFTTFGAMITLPAILLGAIFGGTVALNIDAIKNWLEARTGSTIFDSAYYFLSYIPSKVHWGSVYNVCMFSIVLCMISVILPSLRAKKVLPHESLRWE